ncbi:hypothetical protein [Niabella ginsengisoli]|uniref:Uncharacterized protein n=1 Tax=Niabella ginsengisoli TaxID=522298 RepID=A0ABS9SPL2_9BACT|nr:hypothetical protein [Niabella ginsengisoli]MCH5600186.1 hypothetical protein [Niabella ginsengisoli]
MVKAKIKRGYRIAKYVAYKETLIDRREHFWSFLGAFLGLVLLRFARQNYPIQIICF